MLLLISWAVSRFWLFAIGRWDLWVYPAGPLAFDDLAVYARWLPDLNAGVIPTDDMWQYPPASAFFFLIGSLRGDPETLLMLGILAVDLILTLVLARQDLRAGWYWVAAGVVIGPVLIARFDVVPTLFAVLAIIAAARPVWVGVWAAVGTSLKVWPALLLFTVARRSAFTAGGAFAVALVAILGISSLVFVGSAGFLGGQGSRGLQTESVAALPFLIAQAFGADVTLEYRYGSMEVASGGAGVAAVAATVGLLTLFVWVVWCWLRGRLEQHRPADIGFTVVLFSVVASRVFSPQYTIWLLGIGALCLVDARSLVRTPVLLVAAAAVVTQVLYPWGYGALLGGEPLMTALQTIRIVLVVVAAVWAGYRICWQKEVAASPPAPSAG